MGWGRVPPVELAVDVYSGVVLAHLLVVEPPLWAEAAVLGASGNGLRQLLLRWQPSVVQGDG